MTILGIMSDSHGRAETTRRAVRALVDAGATALIHLGDLETEAVIDELVGHDARIVFGNCDWEWTALERYAGHVSVIVDRWAGRLTVGGRRVAFTHGHLREPMEEATADEVDFLLHGHTHELRDERVGATRVINPGALFRAARYTAAVLEPEQDRLRILDIGKPG